jgi:hypothetical protein
MYGLPPAPGAAAPETPQDAGTLTPSISLTRTPVGNEPFIQFSYEVSMSVFTIALILHQLERKALRRAAAQAVAEDRETAAAKAEAEGKDTVTEQISIGGRSCTTIRNLRDKKNSDNADPHR